MEGTIEELDSIGGSMFLGISNKLKTIKSEFNGTTNPFKFITDSANAEIEMLPQTMANYAKLMIDALKAEGGTDQFKAFWEGLMPDKQSDFINKFGLDFASFSADDALLAFQGVYAKSSAKAQESVYGILGGMDELYEKAKYGG